MAHFKLNYILKKTYEEVDEQILQSKKTATDGQEKEVGLVSGDEIVVEIERGSAHGSGCTSAVQRIWK